MPDMFERELRMNFANEAGCWELLSDIQSRAERRLREVTPNVTKADIRVGARSGSTFSRDNLSDGRKALTENDEQLETVAIELRALTEPDKLWSWEAKVWALAMIKHKTVVVKVSGQSKVAVEGLASTLAAVAPETKKPNDETKPANKGALPVSPEHPKPKNAKPSEAAAAGSWLQNTWRDHAATFVITVVGGVVVIALALVLGLSPHV